MPFHFALLKKTPSKKPIISYGFALWRIVDGRASECLQASRHDLDAGRFAAGRKVRKWQSDKSGRVGVEKRGICCLLSAFDLVA
jgi:hypothetical protein